MRRTKRWLALMLCACMLLGDVQTARAAQGQEEQAVQEADPEAVPEETAEETVRAASEEAAQTYTVSYVLNGGTNSEDNPDTYTVGVQTPLYPAQKTGYSFGGWFTDADCTEENELSSIPDDYADDVTLYAKWEPVTYSVWFNGNGGTSGGYKTHQQYFVYDVQQAPQVRQWIYTSDTSKKLILAGWNTKADGSGTAYQDGQTVKNLSTNGENVTLYAQWQPSNYVIRFDANGGNGAIADIEVPDYSTYVYISENTFSRTGYRFTGWNTKADGSGTAYEEKQRVRWLGTYEGEIITMYAQWETITYSISLDGNGDYDSYMDPISVRYNETVKLSANRYVRTGYSFTGWNTSQDGSGTAYADGASVKNLSAKQDSVVFLYAQWSRHSYTVNFDGNGATSGTMSGQNIAYDTAKALSANAFKRTGYTFTGWNTKANGTGTAYDDGEPVQNLKSGNNEKITLYAQWKVVTYKITYKLNGGENNGENPVSYTVTSAKIALKKPTRTGYTFKGWYTDKDCTAKVTAIANSSTGNKTFYAKWAVNKYTVTFDPNGGTGTMKDKVIAYGKSVKLTANRFKRTGYTFAGWNTKANGKGTAYANKEAVKNLKSKNKAVVTLYAQWKVNSYKVEFVMNNDWYLMSGYMPVKTYQYGKSYKLPANAFKDSLGDYSFWHWNTKADDSGKVYKNKAAVKNLSAKNGATIKLYAIWRVPATEIYVDGDSVTAGFKKALNARVSPEPYSGSTAIGDVITSYKSSNTKILKVSKTGVLTGVKPGTAKVTVKTKLGFKKVIKITVNKNEQVFKPSMNVYDYDYGTPKTAAKKIYYSGSSLKVDMVIANNRMFTADRFEWITLNVYDRNNNVIATKTFRNVWIGLGRYALKTMTFNLGSIPKKDLEGAYVGTDYYYYYTY